MGQVFEKYWTSVSKKPNGFKQLSVDGNIRVYEYDIVFRIRNDSNSKYRYTFYTETIPTYYNFKRDGEIKIMKSKFRDSVYRITNILLDSYGEHDILLEGEEYFKRDGEPFPFIEFIDVPMCQNEKYLNFRLMRDRVKKINEIKNRLKIKLCL